jgi:hypothetical protein
MNTQIQEQRNDHEILVNTLPSVIACLIRAQNNYDSMAYATAFSRHAQVLDEGKTYKGRNEIQNWIDKANKTFKTVMKPVEYFADQQMLKAEISGNFPGSPLVLNYFFDIKDGEIHSLKITG